MGHIELFFIITGLFCVIGIIFLALTWERFVIPQFQYIKQLQNNEEISLKKRQVYISNLIILLIFLIIVLSFSVFSLVLEKFTGTQFLGSLWVGLVGFLIFELGRIMPRK